jgi:hypothetical protein
MCDVCGASSGPSMKRCVRCVGVPSADVTVMGRTSTQNVLLLSTATPEHMGSYAQLLWLGEESLT